MDIPTSRHGLTFSNDAVPLQDGMVVWDQRRLVVVWPGGHRCHVPWSVLRMACQCAQCQTREPYRFKTVDL